MRLLITEKPSVAKHLAPLVGATARADGYFHGPGVVVTNCFGHLFEQAQPEDYDPRMGTWRADLLPYSPDTWRVLPKDSAKKQIRIIGALLKDATEVVNAGDPDNEGQLLVDEVLEHFKCRKPVWRLWSSAQDEASLRAALANLRDNRDFAGFRDAARARARADWLIGMNFSRVYTLRQQALGHRGVIPVGRVQTPTLALVDDRDRAIATFKPVPFHVLTARATHAGGAFTMRWRPGAGQAGLDDEGRLVDSAIADAIVAKVDGQAGAVVEYAKERKREAHPKGLSLTALTVLASKAFGYGASDVLEIAQALYETHKVTSYPRTDCEYLPQSQHADAPKILAAVAANLPAIAGWVELADPSLRSKIWDDSKITAHHGIVPTAQRCNMAALNERELNVYQLVVRGYVAQFFPLHEYFKTTVVAGVAGETFVAAGKTVIVNGWRDLYGPPTAAEDAEEDEDQALPAMAEGDALAFAAATRHDRKTKPPARFTEASLVVAMENIYKYIENEEDKKSLRDGDGIGTPATRAAIIAELKRRGFLAAQGKYIVCADAGRAALAVLPPAIKSAALTAAYQRQLRDIERGCLSVDRFVSEQLQFVSDQVNAAKAGMPQERTYNCPVCEPGFLRRVQRRDKSAYFWSCSEWRRTGCKGSAPDVDGAPKLDSPRKD